MVRDFCRKCFAAGFVRPVTFLWMGFAVRGKELLPKKGPAIVIANHNSHLDALMLMSLFPLHLAPSIRAAAAADYFFRNRAARFVSEHFAGLIPLERGGGARDPLQPLVRALEEKNILLLFPEGSRGSPGAMAEIKPGLWHLARRCPEASIHPVYLHGLGRAMPKGAWIPVPLFADIRVGEPFAATENKREFPGRVKTIFEGLRAQTLAGISARDDDADDDEHSRVHAERRQLRENMDMNTHNGGLPAEERQWTAHDGEKLFYRHWPAATPSGKAVVMFHRGHEHSGRMEHIVTESGLTDFSFFAWDARGHGRSPGARGDAPGIHALVRDVDDFIAHITKTHGILPKNMVILAQSVGAVLAAAWVHDYAPDIRALIVGSPAFGVKLYAPFARRAIALWAKLRGNFFVNSYVKARFLTHDAERIRSFEKDPLITRAISARILTGLYDVSERVVADAAAITAPVQLFISGADWVVRHGPQHAFFNRMDNPLNERHVMPGFYHDTFGEKGREEVFARMRAFIGKAFAAGAEQDERQKAALLGADRSGPSATAQKWLDTPLPPLSPKGLYFSLARQVIRHLGKYSDGMKLGLETGFDSGGTLDYVYENRVRGHNAIGRLLDKAYLESPGWTGIRARKALVEELLARGAATIREAGQPVRLLDVAAGHGRYVLDALEAMGPEGWDGALLRDFSPLNVERGSARIAERGLDAKASFVMGDAFDEADLAAIRPHPTLAVVSGLYELFPDNAMVLASLRGIGGALGQGGYLVYTNQPRHPQQEFIARVLTSHRQGLAWVMRCRSQAEMDCLVREAGFEKIAERIEAQGIFTVSLARRVPPPERETAAPKRSGASAPPNPPQQGGAADKKPARNATARKKRAGKADA